MFICIQFTVISKLIYIHIYIKLQNVLYYVSFGYAWKKEKIIKISEWIRAADYIAVR